jgi:aldehyde dehydrogenase (NAD+)
LAAKSNLKKVTLELGGKSPIIVFPDADLEKAIPKAAYGFLLNSGQACISTNRIYVHADIAEEFVSKLKAHIEQIYVPNHGDPLTGSVRRSHDINIGIGSPS